MQTFIDKYGAKLLTAIGQHIVYVVISVLIAAVIGLALAVFLSRFRKAAGIIMPLVSVFQTIPGIVFIGVLMLKMGMTLWTVLTALSIYAVFPILKNSYQGFLNIDQSFMEVARGCGMNR